MVLVYVIFVRLMEHNVSYSEIGLPVNRIWHKVGCAL